MLRLFIYYNAFNINRDSPIIPIGSTMSKKDEYSKPFLLESLAFNTRRLRPE